MSFSKARPGSVSKFSARRESLLYPYLLLSFYCFWKAKSFHSLSLPKDGDTWKAYGFIVDGKWGWASRGLEGSEGVKQLENPLTFPFSISFLICILESSNYTLNVESIFNRIFNDFDCEDIKQLTVAYTELQLTTSSISIFHIQGT